MIENLNSYLVGIVLGIRFRPNFSIEDQLGKITDTILYSRDAYFSSNVFPQVINNGAGQKAMVNPATHDNLHIDNSNVILDINFSDGNGFVIEKHDEILSEFRRQIIQGILKDYSIKEIVRIGYIKRYLFDIEELANSFVDKTMGNSLEGINDINLSFSKRISSFKSLAKTETNDYDNAIFNIIKKSSKKEIFMSVDYQSFFDPFLPISTSIEFEPFIRRADNFNTRVFLPWLNNYYAEVEHEQATIA